MYIEVRHEMECSKCGSGNYERFFNPSEDGIRCLGCGYEKVISRQTTTYSTSNKPIVYNAVSNPNPEKF
jgi:predicted nucleic-acid-binding Zn-ribbon protein